MSDLFLFITSTIVSCIQLGSTQDQWNLSLNIFNMESWVVQMGLKNNNVHIVHVYIMHNLQTRYIQSVCQKASHKQWNVYDLIHNDVIKIVFIHGEYKGM